MLCYGVFQRGGKRTSDLINVGPACEAIEPPSNRGLAPEHAAHVYSSAAKSWRKCHEPGYPWWQLLLAFFRLKCDRGFQAFPDPEPLLFSARSPRYREINLDRIAIKTTVNRPGFRSHWSLHQQNLWVDSGSGSTRATSRCNGSPAVAGCLSELEHHRQAGPIERHADQTGAAIAPPRDTLEVGDDDCTLAAGREVGRRAEAFG
jgi:hypothetical protein